MSNEILNLSDLVAAGLAMVVQKVKGKSMESQTEWAFRALAYSIGARMVVDRTNMLNNSLVSPKPLAASLMAVGYETLMKRRSLNREVAVDSVQFGAIEMSSDYITNVTLGGERQFI